MCIRDSFQRKGYKVLNLSNQEIFTNRDVTFYEEIFPFQEEPKQHEEDFFNEEPSEETNTHIINTIPPHNQYESEEDEEIIPQISQIPPSMELTEQYESEEEEETAETPTPANNGDTNRISKRIRKMPSYLKDYKLQLASSRHPIGKQISSQNFTPEHYAFLTAIETNNDPSSYKEASKHAKWNNAMKQELEALENNKTWTITKIPEGKKPIGCKWVYKTKFNSDGTIEKHKARLVAKGYNQVEGIDFTETFAPVSKMTTLRVILAIGVSKKWHMHQMDVQNAFLHGTLEETIYMKIPLGLDIPKDSPSHSVCKLNRSLYGLKQASRVCLLYTSPSPRDRTRSRMPSSA